MHRESRQTIEAGLSLGARIVLAIFSAVFGFVMILLASPESGSKRPFFYGFGAFCLLIAIACVTKGRVRQFVGSVIGCALFLVGIAYLANELFEGVLWTSRGGAPSAYKAVLFLLLIGIPGATYALRQRFGFRKSP